MKVKFTDIPISGYPFAADGKGHNVVTAKPDEVHEVSPGVAAMLIQAGKAETYIGDTKPVEVAEATEVEDETKGGFKDPEKVKAEKAKEEAEAKVAEEASKVTKVVDSLNAVAIEAQKDGVSDKDAKTMLAEWADKNDYEVDKRKGVPTIIEGLTELATEADAKAADSNDQE